jgi:drug/metabolite transporter (DMT)-like permease
MDRSADFNGIVLVILSFLSLNLGDLFSKLLVRQGQSVYEIILYNNSVVLVAILIYAFVKKESLIPVNLKLSIIRGLIAFIAGVSFYTGLSITPLTELIPVTLLSPIVGIFLARKLLNEIFSPWIWFWGFIALIGALLASNITFAFSLGIIFGLVTAVGNAVVAIMVKMMPKEGVLSMTTVLVTVGILLVIPIVFFQETFSAPIPLNLINGFCILGFLIFNILAYKIVRRASTLPIYQYSLLIFAGIIGTTFLEETITLLALTGMVLILISGIFTAKVAND